MLDLSYFQNNNSNVQGFFNGGTWQTWIKPRGAKLVNFFVVGSGAGGGGGFQLSTAPKAGGGSGGSGATARLTINANLLPDILYILPGIGGAGGLGGNPATAGSAGQNSFVTLIPDTSSISNVVLRSGTTPATAGTGGSGSSGLPGAAGTIGAIGNNIFANLGTFSFQAGVGGQNGWYSSNPAGVTPTNFLVQAGGGGGTVGSVINASGVFPAMPATAQLQNGINGPIYYKPTLMLYGGRGGVGAPTVGTNGGNGGNGAPGCGGGGGGTGWNVGVNAGNGGRGGDGFVIITTSF
jgi:hypothetical protein